MNDFSKKLEGMSMTTGTVRYGDLAYVLTTEDQLAEERVPHTIILTRDREVMGIIQFKLECLFRNCLSCARRTLYYDR